MNKDELKQFLKENLTIIVCKAEGGFTDPNGFNIKLKVDGEVISSAYINVRQTREYQD